MKFKFQVSNEGSCHVCCIQQQKIEIGTNYKAGIMCKMQSKKLKKSLIQNLGWFSITWNNLVINSNTCFYNEEAIHLEIRTELITWMLHLCYKLRFTLKTYHLAIYILDGLLSVSHVEMEDIKLITYLALHLSAKFEESTDKVPSLESVAELFDNEFSLEKLKSSERIILSVFGFALNRHTIYVELEELLQQDIIFCSDLKTSSGKLKLEHTLVWMKNFFDWAKEKLIIKYELYKFHPRVVAVSLIYIALQTIGLNHSMSHLLHSNSVSLKVINDCVNFLQGLCLEQINFQINSFFENYNEETESEDYYKNEYAYKQKSFNDNDQRRTSQSSVYTVDSIIDFSSFK